MRNFNRFDGRVITTSFFSVPARLIRPLPVLLLILLSFISALAQDGNGGSSMPDDVAPPPLKIISREEKDQLASESGVKDRSIIYLNLLEARLKKAEDLSAQEDFVSTLTQFGSYEGLLESMVNFLTSENKSGKALWSFKKLELTLRAHNVRIESVRRVMPFKYAYHLTRLQKFIRKSRATATESLFSDSVVRVPEDKSDKKEEQKP
jgi:hypothetical protein